VILTWLEVGVPASLIPGLSRCSIRTEHHESGRYWLLVGALSAVAACGEGGAVGPDGANAREFRIEAAVNELAEGQSLTLRVTADGVPVDAGRVAWETRNPAAFAVNNGTVRALGAGMGYVVARSGTRADSVALAVRFSRRPEGGAVFRVAGFADQPIRLSGMSLLLESLRSQRHSTAIFAHSRPVESPLSALDAAFSGDSTLAIRVPRQLAVGRHPVSAFTVEAGSGLRIVGAEGIYLRLRDGDARWRMYFAVGTSTLEITSIELPEAMGNIPGKLTGRVQFDAAGFIHAVDEQGVPRLTPIGDRVVPVYAEFSVDLYHHPISGSVAEIGGPFAGTAGIGGSGSIVDGALSVYWNGLVNFGTSMETYAEGTLRVPAPATGTFSFARSDGATPPSASLRMTFARFVRVPPGDDPSGHLEDLVTGDATSGALTITEYRPATADHFGVLRARLNATLPLSRGDATVSITDLVLPIAPLDGDVLDPVPQTPLARVRR
jgi:hypothetical protein